MNVFALIGHAVVILTLAIIVLSLFTVGGRLLGELREARIQRRRASLQQALDAYLGGGIDRDTIIEHLTRDRRLALDVMVGAASKLERGARVPLRRLFDTLSFAPGEIAMLGSRRWPVRMRAATHLAYMDDINAVPALTEALKDEMLDVRLAAARALAELQSVESIEHILRALALPAAWPLQRCTEILYAMGSPVVDPLLAFLADKQPEHNDSARCVCVRVLGMLRAREAAHQVSMFLHSGNLELRLGAVKALGEMGDPEVVPALSLLLDDRSWEVRSAVALALGRLGGPAALPALQQLLADPAWWVRFNAAESLYRLGAPGTRALEHVMSTHRDSFARDIGRQILEEHGVLRAMAGQPA